ncbi:MAG: CinA family nicotinamide mononucleotide deamidase-related protein [Aggregatilineales bacterium]
MQAEPNAEIIAIGTEILLGELTDTNSVFMARALRDIGVNLYYMTTVGDNEARIASAIRAAMGRAQIVITCGGLGPTVDDVTRQAVAAATGRDLTFHQDLLDKIADRFSGFRVQMTENNRRQAYVPADAIIIENPVGTAPAFIVEQGDRVVISLPGVPREMKFLFMEHVVPFLRRKYALGGTVIKARVLKTAGVGESMLDEAIGEDLLQASNPTVGLAAHSGQVDIRITAKATSLAEADALILATEGLIRKRVGQYIFGADSDTLEQALIEALKSRSATLVISEIGIEPVISGRLKTIAADDVLKNGWHFSALEALDAHDLKLDLSLSARQLAEQVAQRAIANTNADIGIAVVCRSAEGVDHADSEELSAVAVCYGDSIRSRAYGFGSGVDVAKQWSATWAMATAWRMLRENDASV